MTEFLFYILAGGSVGFIVGVTGVGGGSFMTPILLAFGFLPAVAVGTDLLYAAITKANGVIAHQKQNTIDWRIVSLLSMGSIPASIGTTVYLNLFPVDQEFYGQIITNTLGFMLVITGLALLLRNTILKGRENLQQKDANNENGGILYAKRLTVIMGVALGVLVTLSSVGAGAFGAAVLLTLFPRIPTVKVIGTDLAHAVPLTAIAGLGHMQMGNVNWFLLLGLIVGSLPAIWVGTKVGYKLSDKLLQPIMITILIGLGFKYLLF